VDNSGDNGERLVFHPKSIFTTGIFSRAEKTGEKPPITRNSSETVYAENVYPFIFGFAHLWITLGDNFKGKISHFCDLTA